MKKRFIAVIMSLVMCASLVLPVGYADVKLMSSRLRFWILM